MYAPDCLTQAAEAGAGRRFLWHVYTHEPRMAPRPWLNHKRQFNVEQNGRGCKLNAFKTYEKWYGVNATRQITELHVAGGNPAEFGTKSRWPNYGMRLQVGPLLEDATLGDSKHETGTSPSCDRRCELLESPRSAGHAVEVETGTSPSCDRRRELLESPSMVAPLYFLSIFAYSRKTTWVIKRAPASSSRSNSRRTIRLGRNLDSVTPEARQSHVR
jgi:hypothetical protein